MAIRDYRETAIHYVAGEDVLTVFTGENKYINKLNKLKDEYPNDISVVHENDDGSVVVKLPTKWFKFPRPPKKMSDEKRAQAGERMRAARLKNA